MHKPGKIIAILAACLALGVFFYGPVDASAAAKTVSVEGAAFSVNRTMAENIGNFKGKTVYVTLDSGETIAGKVVDVNASYLHLAEIERMDFFDAFIDMRHISAVKARFRKYENQ